MYRSFRAHRALAYKFVLDWQSGADQELRITEPALLMTAAAPWFLNGIHSTPDDGPTSREIMFCTLPHIRAADAEREALAYKMSLDDDEEEDGEPLDSDDEGDVPARHRTQTGRTVPVIQHGATFFRDSRIGDVPCPRFENSRHRLSDRTLKFTFKLSREALEFKFLQSHLVTIPNPRRTSNRKRITTTYVPPPVNDDDDPVPLFALARDGLEIHGAPVDDGSDMETDYLNDAGGSDPDDDVPLPDDIDDAAHDVWQQFLFDMTALSPNPKEKELDPYCILSPTERLQVNERTYQSNIFSAYFTDCAYRVATTKSWRLGFDRLWPGLSAKKKAKLAQNYRHAKYYHQWGVLLRRNKDNTDTIEAMRVAFKKRFDTLYWVPHAQSDRMWATGHLAKFEKNSNLPLEQAAPRILINPKLRNTPPVWL